MFTIADLPVGMFAVALMIMLPVGIYEYRTFEKKNPGNPMNKMILVAIPMMIMIFLSKCVDEIRPNTILSRVVGITALGSGVLFFVGLVVAWTLSYKWGYIDKERVKQGKPIFIGCAIIATLGLTLVLVGVFLL